MDAPDAVLRAIAEPHRREILRLAGGAEMCAGEIASHFELTRPAVSQHLRVLREAGLLDERREGARRLYRARPEGIGELRDYLEGFWGQGLERLRFHAEAEQQRRGIAGPMPTDSGAVVCEVRIAAAPETVFGFFTDPERATRWMGDEATLDPSPGGIYRVRVQPEHTARGEFVEVDPPRRVVFTWGWEEGGSPVAPGASTVEVELEPDGDATVVRLTHRDLPEESRDGHRMGWTHYLDRLSVVGTGGDPGPDSGPGSQSGDS